MALIIFGWLIFSFIVALMGNGKKIGFWIALIISLIVSPFIGFIVVILSDSETVPQYLKSIELGEKYEFQMKNKDALDSYREALFYLSKDNNSSNKTISNYRKEKSKELEMKIDFLTKKIDDESDSAEMFSGGPQSNSKQI